jgi:hypothetical protein
MTDLIERLRECLPTAADGPDHLVWCSVRGSDLREATDAIDAATSRIERLETALRAIAKLNPHWLELEAQEIARVALEKP